MDIFVESPKYGEGYVLDYSFKVTKKSYNWNFSCKIDMGDLELVYGETILNEKINVFVICQIWSKNHFSV